MKKIIYIIALSLIVSYASEAQDRSIYSQAHLYPILINPALSGHSGQHDILFSYKNSFAAFDDSSPKTFTVSYDGLVTDRVGLGATFFSENIGALRRYRAQLSYAYKFSSDDFDMSIGLSTEFLQEGLTNSAILGGFYEPGDAVLEEGLDGIQFFDATLGFFTTYQERTFVGISIPSLIRARIDQISGVGADPENTFFQHFTLMLGHKFTVKDYNFDVIPSLLVRRLYKSPFFADLNVLVSFLDEQLTAGLTYGIGGASRVSFLLGTKINNFRLSYSYDIGLGAFQGYNNGGHEITVGISIDKVPRRVKIDDTETEE